MSEKSFVGRVCVVALVAASPLAAVDGELDLDFSGDGKVTSFFHSKGDFANAVAATNDGRVVTAGASEFSTSSPADWDFFFAAFTSAGAPSSAFDTDGKSALFFDLATSQRVDEAHAVVAMADGRVVACGTATYDNANENRRLVVGRLLANGGPDTSFSADGELVLTPFDHADSDSGICKRMVVEPDGRIVLPFSNWPYHEAGLIRLEEDGDYDPTFGGDGISELLPCSTDDDDCDAREALKLPGGGYMLVGSQKVEVAPATFERHLLLARYTSGGLLDDTFGSEGVIRLHVPDGGFTSETAKDAALDSAGRIVILDRASKIGSTRYTVVRVLANGSVDSGFGSSGWKTLDERASGSLQISYESLAVQGDGKIVLAGAYQPGTGEWNCFADRLVPSGTTRDSGFGVNGTTVVAFDLGNPDDVDICYGIALEAGRPVLAGIARVNDTFDAAVLRLTNSFIFADPFESGSTLFWSSTTP